jgi:uncharacterized membrane protein YcaP (DUF421 family)
MVGKLYYSDRKLEASRLTEAAELFTVTIRSVLAFFSLLVFMRLMRKKQLSQYTFYDYVVGITIGSIASTLSIELENRTVSVYWGLIIWAVLPVFLGWLYLKSIVIRKIFDSEPVVLIKEGKILEDNLKRELLNLEDLQMQLRSVGIFELADVEYAILEKNGQVNAMKKKEKQPVTPGDLNLPVLNKGGPLILVLDGKIMRDTLQHSPYSKAWLLGELNKKGITDVSQVVVAQVDTAGSLYVDVRRDEESNIPPDTSRERIKANLQKAVAELTAFALESDAPEAKEIYTRLARELDDLSRQLSSLTLSR